LISIASLIQRRSEVTAAIGDRPLPQSGARDGHFVADTPSGHARLAFLPPCRRKLRKTGAGAQM